MDDFTGRHGPSVGRPDIRAQLLDYIIETFYPEIQRRHLDRLERNASFFREVLTIMHIVKTSFAFIIVTLKQEFECKLLKLKRNLFYSDTIEKHFNNQKNVSPF